MALKIKASTLFEACTLEILPTGVKYLKTALVGGKRVVAFSQIDCVLLSTSGLLSFQVGSEVFKIQTKPDDPKHNQVIEALVKGVRSALAEPPTYWR